MSASVVSSALRTPNSIWAKVLEQNAAASKKQDRGDSYVFFTGSKGSGKSTLLNRFLYPDRVETPKPSQGLEYTYARKPAQYDHEKKDLAHIWEVGGSLELGSNIVQEENIFLTFKQVTTAVVIIVVDLSEPAQVLNTLEHWLDHTKKKLAATFEKFEKRGLQLPEQLRTRAKLKLFNGHEDKDLVYHSGVSLVIVATKYDTFRDQDPECKKVMARALRFVAHAHGAHLMYVGGLHAPAAGQAQGGGGGRASSGEDKQLLDSFRVLLNHLAFNGIERKLPDRLKAQADHLGAVFMPAGQDRFRDIGRPRSGPALGDQLAVADCLREWQEVAAKMFPAKASKGALKDKFVIPDQYAEEEVDAALKEKMQELELYRKQQADALEAKRRATVARQQQQQQAGSGSAATAKPKQKKSSSSKTAAA